MAKSAKKEVAVKESPIQSHLKGEATNKRVAGATRKAKQIGDAINARLKQLQSSALALVNAFNAEDTAGDAVSAARKVFYAECQQSYGKKFFDADKSITNQIRVIFYKAHFESKGLAVNVSINPSRGEIKSDKDPNNRQSSSKNKKSVQEIVQDHGQRCYNACYKNDLKQASVELQAWATKWFKSKIKYAVPAGQK